MLAPASQQAASAAGHKAPRRQRPSLGRGRHALDRVGCHMITYTRACIDSAESACSIEPCVPVQARWGNVGMGHAALQPACSPALLLSWAPGWDPACGGTQPWLPRVGLRVLAASFAQSVTACASLATVPQIAPEGGRVAAPPASPARQNNGGSKRDSSTPRPAALRPLPTPKHRPPWPLCALPSP